MVLIVTALLVPLLCYGLRTAMVESDEFTTTIRISRFLFVVCVFFFSVLLSIEKNNYYLVGYRSTSIVYLTATVTGIVYVLSDRRFILSSFKRIILNIFAVTLMMGSPFLLTEMLSD